MLLVEGTPRQSVDRWNVGIKYSPLKRVLPVRYSRTNDNADWYCHLCIIDIFPFNKLEEFEFQLALAEFSIGYAKIGFKSLDELHINPFTLNNKYKVTNSFQKY